MPRFTDDLKSIGFGCYADYLASPLWASIRSRVYASKGRMCLDCKMRRATQIHHRQYDLETLKGDTLNYLVPICRQCHRAEHGLETPQTVAPIVIPWNPQNYRVRKKNKATKAVGTPKTARKQGKLSRQQKHWAATASMRPPQTVACTVCRKECKTPAGRAWVGFICEDCAHKPKFPELTRNQVKDVKIRAAKARTEEAMKRASEVLKSQATAGALRGFMKRARMSDDRQAQSGG